MPPCTTLTLYNNAYTVTRQNNLELKWTTFSIDGNSPFFAVSDVIEFDMSVCCVRSHYHLLSSSRTAAPNNSAQPVTQHRLSPYLVSARLYQLGAGDSPSLLAAHYSYFTITVYTPHWTNKHQEKLF